MRLKRYSTCLRPRRLLEAVRPDIESINLFSRYKQAIYIVDINRRYGGAHVIMAPCLANTKEHSSLDGVVMVRENARKNTDRLF